MSTETLAEALEREHVEIDQGIEAFLERPDAEAGAICLRRAIAALRRHIYLEEQFVFPPLREAGMVMPVLVMLREHGEIWTSVDAIDAARAQNADPGTVSTACEELLARLERHNLKEEAVLYPQTDPELPAAAAEQLRAFLASGHTPAGWVCAGARASDRSEGGTLG